MYFDQYFIKPAFATLTSLLRTYSAQYLAAAFLYIFGFQFLLVLFVLHMFHPFQSRFFYLPDIRRSDLFVFPSFPLGVQR